MNYDSKHQALRYHRELFSSLYDIEVDKTSSSEHDRQAPTGHLTSPSGCGILEVRPLGTPMLHHVTGQSPQ